MNIFLSIVVSSIVMSTCMMPDGTILEVRPVTQVEESDDPEHQFYRGVFVSCQQLTIASHRRAYGKAPTGQDITRYTDACMNFTDTAIKNDAYGSMNEEPTGPKRESSTGFDL